MRNIGFFIGFLLAMVNLFGCATAHRTDLAHVGYETPETQMMVLDRTYHGGSLSNDASGLAGSILANTGGGNGAYLTPQQRIEMNRTINGVPARQLPQLRQSLTWYTRNGNRATRDAAKTAIAYVKARERTIQQANRDRARLEASRLKTEAQNYRSAQRTWQVLLREIGRSYRSRN